MTTVAARSVPTMLLSGQGVEQHSQRPVLPAHICLQLSVAWRPATTLATVAPDLSPAHLRIAMTTMSWFHKVRHSRLLHRRLRCRCLECICQALSEKKVCWNVSCVVPISMSSFVELRTVRERPTLQRVLKHASFKRFSGRTHTHCSRVKCEVTCQEALMMHACIIKQIVCNLSLHNDHWSSRRCDVRKAAIKRFANVKVHLAHRSLQHNLSCC